MNAERVVLRALAALQRHGEALAAAEEVGRLERQLAEEPLELRDAGAEGQLVAVLLFELHPARRPCSSAVGVLSMLTSLPGPSSGLK